MENYECWHMPERVLSSVERNYCTTRKEMLAIVYGLHQHRQYLLGRHIIIRTDHSALQSMKKTPEPVGQQARWLDFIEQFDYEVKHRAGTSHGNADGLSRRPCERETDIKCRQCDKEKVRVSRATGRLSSTTTGHIPDSTDHQLAECQAIPVITEAMWENEALSKAQQEDSEIAPTYRLKEAECARPTWNEIQDKSESVKNYWNQWPALELKDRILYRRFYDNAGLDTRMQVLVPQRLREDLIKRTHTGMTGGHLGVRKTQAQVQARGYWHGWRSEVNRYCQRCEECCGYHRGLPPRQGRLQPLAAGAAMERIHIDLTGPHVKSCRGFVYILTCIDPFTKYAEAIPLRDKTAVSVAKALMEQIFPRYGLPLSICSDLGKEFENSTLYEICNRLGITKLRTTAYKASTNGAIERLHRTLNSMLGKVVGENQKDWCELLPFVMAAYRSSRHESTGFSPNFLTFGREVRAPVDLVLGQPVDDELIKNVDEFAETLLSKQRKAYELVRSQLGVSAERAKRYYDAKAKPMEFRRGDWVWIYCPRKYQGRSAKWSRSFGGPFLVEKVLGPVNYVVRRSRRSRPQIVHIDKMKSYRGNPPPSWLDLKEEDILNESAMNPDSRELVATKPEEVNTPSEGQSAITGQIPVVNDHLPTPPEGNIGSQIPGFLPPLPVGPLPLPVGPLPLPVGPLPRPVGPLPLPVGPLPRPVGPLDNSLPLAGVDGRHTPLRRRPVRQARIPARYQ
jgi:transposase InsO family protein